VARETIIVGALTALSQPHSVGSEIETPKMYVDREGTSGKIGRVSPHHPTRGLGGRRKLPKRGLGRSPGWNGFYAYLRSQRIKPSGTPFSVFWAMAGPPNVAGPGETFPLSSPPDGPEYTYGTPTKFPELFHLHSPASFSWVTTTSTWWFAYVFFYGYFDLSTPNHCLFSKYFIHTDQWSCSVWVFRN